MPLIKVEVGNAKTIIGGHWTDGHKFDRRPSTSAVHTLHSQSRMLRYLQLERMFGSICRFSSANKARRSGTACPVNAILTFLRFAATIKYSKFASILKGLNSLLSHAKKSSQKPIQRPFTQWRYGSIQSCAI